MLSACTHVGGPAAAGLVRNKAASENVIMQNVIDQMPDRGRLTKQIEFIIEMDRLKHVVRQSLVADGSRRENTAEHSWHVALMAMILAEHAALKVDPLRVLKMLLIHDLVEIDAGDTFLYGTQPAARKSEREAQAADRIFSLLPPDQGAELRALWDEFEQCKTPDGIFARSVDRLQPILLDYCTQGGCWQPNGVTGEQVRTKNSVIEQASTVLWDHVQQLIDDAVKRGYLA
jgi:putative hydrolase of HD superfamily